MTPLINEVARAGESEPGPQWVVVLDDYHAIESAEVHEAVSFLLDHPQQHPDRHGHPAADRPSRRTAAHARQPRLETFPLPLIVHVVGAVCYALFGAFQFSARPCRRHLDWHR